MEEVQPRWVAIQQLCREAGIEVVYTVMESMTRDGRDRSLDYKISGTSNWCGLTKQSQNISG